MIKYQDTEKSSIDSTLFNLLIVTATEVETKAFHETIIGDIYKVISGDYTYYLGRCGQYNVIHVQCLQMGSLNPGGSAQTINSAFKEWPGIRAVIMVGICFGVDKSKQQIGDIVVSTSIRNYETRRVGKKQEIPRGGTYQADKCLLNAFNNLTLTWENIGIDDQKKNLFLGEYLSGEQLVDNEDARDKLLEEAPEAKAGEMEGNGMVASCGSARVPWILVKAICDYADGNKRKNKKLRQSIASASSASCCSAALEQATAFQALGVNPISVLSKSIPAIPVQENHYEVLFEMYRKEYAPFFLRRDIDDLIESYLSYHSLWVYGVSGVGKSTSISHALFGMETNILLINMAGVAPNGSLDEIYEWIYYEVAEYVGETTIAPLNYQLCIKKIISLLDSHYAGQSVYVLVEEIPFAGDSFSTFVASFSSLVVSDKLTGNTADVHFVLSSIENPLPHVPEYLQKIKSMISFLRFELWKKEECEKLVELIENNLPIPKIKETSFLIEKCGNLPRPIKTLFREVYQTHFDGELDTQKINAILARF